MSLTTIVPAAVEPMTSQDLLLREHLHLEGDETGQTFAIEAYISAARDMTETYLRRRLIEQTVRLTLDGFCRGGRSNISLPVAPIQSIEQVQYLDSEGDWQAVDPEAYRLVDSMEPNVLSLEPGQAWPVPRPGAATVRVDMVVGYGPNGRYVPPRFLQAIREQVAYMFMNKGDASSSAVLSGNAETFLKSSVLWI